MFPLNLLIITSVWCICGYYILGPVRSQQLIDGDDVVVVLSVQETRNGFTLLLCFWSLVWIVKYNIQISAWWLNDKLDMLHT